MKTLPSIPKYEVINHLGSGGAGDVFLAREKESEKSVAIKILNADNGIASTNEEAIKRFSDEIEATLKVHSRYVLRALDWGKSKNGTPYVVYEYMSGGTLTDNLNVTGPMKFKEALQRVIIPLLKGLYALHERRIIHRDIKPENLFLHKDGYYTIGDCGLASFSSRNAKTKTGMIVGTPQFMSPERLAPKHKHQIQSDIFSAGMVILKTLTGQLPAGSQQKQGIPVQFTRAITEKDLLQCKLHPSLIPVILKSLAPSPDQRYSSAKSFLAAFARITTADMKVPKSIKTSVIRKAEPDLQVKNTAKTSVIGQRKSYVKTPSDKRARRPVKKVVAAIIFGICALVLFSFLRGRSIDEYSIDWLKYYRNDNTLFSTAYDFSQKNDFKTLSSFMQTEETHYQKATKSSTTKAHLQRLQSIKNTLSADTLPGIITGAIYSNRSGNKSDAIQRYTQGLKRLESGFSKEAATGDLINKYTYLLGILISHIGEVHPKEQDLFLHTIISSTADLFRDVTHTHVHFKEQSTHEKELKNALSIGKHLVFICRLLFRAEALNKSDFPDRQLIDLVRRLPWAHDNHPMGVDFFSQAFASFQVNLRFEKIDERIYNEQVKNTSNEAYLQYQETMNQYIALGVSYFKDALFRHAAFPFARVRELHSAFEKYAWSVIGSSKLGYNRDRQSLLDSTGKRAQVLYYFYEIVRRYDGIYQDNMAKMKDSFPKELSISGLADQMVSTLKDIDHLSNTTYERQAWKYALLDSIIDIEYRLNNQSIRPVMKEYIDASKTNEPFAWFGISSYHWEKLNTRRPSKEYEDSVVKKLCEYGGIKTLAVSSQDLSSQMPKNWFTLALATLPGRWERMLGHSEMDKTRLSEAQGIINIIQFHKQLPPHKRTMTVFEKETTYSEGVSLFMTLIEGATAYSEEPLMRKLACFALAHTADAELAINGSPSIESQKNFSRYLLESRNDGSTWGRKLLTKERLIRGIDDFRPSQICPSF